MERSRPSTVRHGKHGAPGKGASGTVRPARILALVAALGLVMALGAPALSQVEYEPSDIKSPDGAEEGDRWGERTDVAQLTDDNEDGNVDSDDTQDVVVGVFNHDVDVDGDGTKEDAVGRAYALDGETLSDDTPTKLFDIDLPVTGHADAWFAFYIAVLGDVTGGDEEDIAVGARNLDVDVDGDGTAESNVGKAWVFDGADGTKEYELTNPDEQEGQRFGARIGNAGDQNGDGVNDVILGSPTTDVDLDDDGSIQDNEKDIGRAYVNDGSDGSHLFTLENPDEDNPQTQGNDAADDVVGPQFGKSVQGIGDLGSGSASTSKDQITDLYVNAFRYSENVGDVDGDGDDEIAERGRSYVFSGGTDRTTQGLLTRLDSPEAQQNASSAYDEENDEFIQTPAWFGIQEVKPDSPGDIGGDSDPTTGEGRPDGTPDIYGASFRQDVVDDPGANDDDDSCDDPTASRCNENEGKSWVFDGAASIDETNPSDGLHGETLYQLTDPHNEQPGSSFGWSLSKTDDPMDSHDEWADLYVGQIPHPHDEGGPQGGNGGTYVFDGTDQVAAESDDAAEVHRRLELPDECRQTSDPDGGNRPPALGWTNSTLDDVDGDEEPDYVAGAPWVDLPSKGDTQDAGILMFFGSDSLKNMNDCEES